MIRRINKIAGAVVLATVCASAANAQDDKLGVSLSLNHDAFFGTNPMLAATYNMDNGKDLTFYGIQWGTGTGSAWGQWTEFGVGMGFEALDGLLYVNPQIGFTFGSLLSSGAAGDGVVGDGYVPNLTVNLNHDQLEGQFYYGLYKDLRDTAPAGGSTNEYTHYWLNLGKKLNSYFSVGLHYEELTLSGGSNVADLDGYEWIGPYFQVTKGNAGMRMSFGDDRTSDTSSFSINDFYKLQFFFSF